MTMKTRVDELVSRVIQDGIALHPSKCATSVRGDAPAKAVETMQASAE